MRAIVPWVGAAVALSGAPSRPPTRGRPAGCTPRCGAELLDRVDGWSLALGIRSEPDEHQVGVKRKAKHDRLVGQRVLGGALGRRLRVALHKSLLHHLHFGTDASGTDASGTDAPGELLPGLFPRVGGDEPRCCILAAECARSESFSLAKNHSA